MNTSIASSSLPITYEPRPYQQQALEWLISREKAALFLDVGLGKSSVCLLDMVVSLALGDVNRWLIVAPLRVCQTTWPSEFAKWSFMQSITTYNMAGPQKDRAAASDAALSYQITVINVENLPKLIRHFGNAWPWDGVVIDESSKFKDSSTQRWKSLRGITAPIQRLRLLTGSPCAQNLMNLWSQVFLIDRGERLSKRLTGFKYTYFQQMDYLGYDWQPRPGARDRVMEKIKDVCLSIKAEGMPEPVYNRIPVTLSDKALAIYEEMEEDFILELDDAVITALSAGVLTNKLSQLANGFGYWESDDGDKQVTEIHREKVKAVEEFAEETGHPFILGFHYQYDRDRLLEHFGSRMEVFDATQDQLQRWGRGQFQILALHPQSGGHGVDGLQHHTCTVLWYSPPWSREQFDQLNGRVTGARQVGTAFENTQSVINILTAEDTIDRVAYKVLFQRGEEQKQFLARLNEYRQSVLGK